MFTLYTTEDKLTELCLEGEEWFDIIRNQPTIYVCNESDNDEWDVTNATLMALHRSGTSIEVDNELLEEIKEDNSKVLELVNPAYILDFKAEDAKSIEEKYGVIFLPTSNTPRPVLAKRGWDIDTADNSKPNTWEFFLKGNKVNFNSLVIVDRYFFSSQTGETFEDSLFNLRMILNSLLPAKNMHKFTVSIIFDESKSDFGMQELATKVNKVKKNIIGKTPFTLELISIDSNCYMYEETHDRFIISNYFVINASHKIKAFNAQQKSLCAQKLTFDYLYSKGIEEDDISSTPEVSQDRVLKALCDTVHTSKSEIQYAANGQVNKKGVFTIKNDLFCY